jgi:hypothetical protein
MVAMAWPPPLRRRPTDPYAPPVALEAGAETRLRSSLVNVGTQRDTDFVRLAPRRFFVGLYVAAVVLFGSWGYYVYAPGGPANNTTPWPLALCLPLAKVCGRILTLTLCLLMVTAMRSTARWARSLTVVRFLVPLDALMPDFHRVLAFTAAGAATGHVLFHCLDYAFLGGSDQLPWTGGFCITFSGVRPNLCLLYTGATAALLLLTIVIIALVYLARVRQFVTPPAPPGRNKDSPDATSSPGTPLLTSTARRPPGNFAIVQLWFTMVAHWVLVPLFLLVVCVHAQSKGYSYVAIPFWILTVALYLDVRARYRGTTVRVDRAATAVHGNILRLVVERPPGFVFKAGQSALLHMDLDRTALPDDAKPWLHRWQYHPFTIASSPAAADRTDRLVFLIRDQGNRGSWTTALHRAITTGGLSEVQVAGPNGAPYEYYDGFETVLLVGMGAGVTPLAAIFASMAHDEMRARRAGAAPTSSSSSAGSGASSDKDSDHGEGGGTASVGVHHVGSVGAINQDDGASHDDDDDDDDDDDKDERTAPTLLPKRAAAALVAAVASKRTAEDADSDDDPSWAVRTAGPAPLAARVLSPRLLIYTCVVVLALTLAIGVYIIVDAQSLVYDWVMVTAELAVTWLFLTPLFALRLLFLVTRSAPMPAEWALELVLLLLAAGGGGVAAWGVVILVGTGSPTEGNTVYWFVWMLLSLQGGLTVLLVLARSLVFIFYRAPFAADRISGRPIAFAHRTVQLWAFVDRPMQAGLQAVLQEHTDALRASGLGRDQFAVTLFGSKGFDPVDGASSLADYVDAVAKTADEVATDDYLDRFVALIHGRLREAHKRRHQRMNFIGVFYCGSPKLSANLYAAVQRAEAEHTAHLGCNCYVSFHEERFF